MLRTLTANCLSSGGWSREMNDDAGVPGVGLVSRSGLQSFAEFGGPANTEARVVKLRRELADVRLTGFLVPRADEHQNEYVAPDAERLLWLTGFSGSAGVAVVLEDKAALFVDGRYTEQAKSQLDQAVFEPLDLPDEPSDWIGRNVRPGDRIGYDPRLHTSDSVRRFKSACERSGAALVAVQANPIDKIWRDRPAPSNGTITVQNARLSGESATSKLARLRRSLGDTDGLLVSDPHNLAWLFNIRGTDISHTPLALGYAFVPKEGRPRVFLDLRKLSPGAAKHLAKLAEISDPGKLLGFVATLGARGLRTTFDSSTASTLISQTFRDSGGTPEIGADPTTLMKATKNKAELAGARAAHERDGAALARFLAWFDEEAPRGRLTEMDAVKALEEFRRATGVLKDISFPTIAGSGPNSSLPHYRVTESSNRRIERGIFLIDSGAQYVDGTTDVTRTIVIGRPTSIMRDRFTRVLKGHIAIADAVFPEGTTGAQIDVLARMALWRSGLDFDHGTGHGVGSYLSVHEGPHRISKAGTTRLIPGMILSDEPGYYSPRAFGIRTENLVVVERRAIAGAERQMLGFETLTLAPIDLRLIDGKLLGPNEIRWVNAYHARVRRALAPLVDAFTGRWLIHATRRFRAA
jgi:Xaa-Pro aminopeptidase